MNDKTDIVKEEGNMADTENEMIEEIVLETPREEKRETQPKVKKTANMNKYMCNYMRQRYNKDKDSMRLYKNNQNVVKKYNFSEEMKEDFGEYLYNAVKIIELLNGMSNETREKLIFNHEKYKVCRK